MMTYDKLIEKVMNLTSREKVCEYCLEKYIAKKLNQQFCCDDCADKNYNENVRPLKQAEKLKEQQFEEERKIEAVKKSVPTHETLLRKSIAIFDKLTIDPIVGTHYKTADLANIGVDFNVYSYKERIASKQGNCYALFCGRYKLTNINNETIKIETLKITNHDK